MVGSGHVVFSQWLPGTLFCLALIAIVLFKPDPVREDFYAIGKVTWTCLNWYTQCDCVYQEERFIGKKNCLILLPWRVGQSNGRLVKRTNKEDDPGN